MMTLFFSCKKLRRSTRLEVKETVSKKLICSSRPIVNSPFGSFELLPLEMKFFLFSYLPGRC